MGDQSNEKQSGLLELLKQLKEQGVSDAEKIATVRTYLGYRAREAGVPIRGTFELTPLCNLNCKMCYVHLTNEKLQASGQKLLSATQWIHIMEQAIAEGMIGATLTGGEAMTHPEFEEIFLYLQERGIEVSIKSNGILLTEERVHFFTQHPPRKIQITLYGSDDDTYEKVTGSRCFSKVIEGILRVQKSGIPVSISITPNKYMKDNILDTLRLMDKMGLEVGINSHLMEPRCETGNCIENIDLSTDEYVELYKERAKMQHLVILPIPESCIPIPPVNETPIVGLPCGGGKSSFSVKWNGRIYPCLMMEDAGVDLSVNTFHEAWLLVHQKVKNYLFPGECMKCKMRLVCPACVLQHDQSGNAEHANENICKRAKRLFAEGLVTYNKIGMEEMKNEKAVCHADCDEGKF